jgi:CRP/FNR family cyclic AMP-dependent transcriptional regulator
MTEVAAMGEDPGVRRIDRIRSACDFGLADGGLDGQGDCDSTMTPSSPLQELPAIGFLSEVDADHRAFLASFGSFVRPHAGDTLIEEGKEQENLYLILSGLLHVVATAGGRNILVAALGAGDSLGEVNVFDPAKASASVVAKSECLIWRISATELEGFFNDDPAAGLGFMKGLLRLVGHRIRSMNTKLAESEQKAEIHSSFWKSNA